MVEFKINQESMKTLGKMISAEKSRLSPFTYDYPETDQTLALTLLKEKAILTETGAINPDAGHALKVLNEAKSAFSLHYTGTPELFDYRLYADQGTGSAVSMLTSKKELIIKDPADHEEALAFIADCTGLSELTSSAFSAGLSEDEAALFCTLLDLQRKNAWQAMAEGKPLKKTSFSSGELEAEMKEKATGQQLSGFLEKLTGSLRYTATAFDTLCAKELITSAADRFSLADEGFILASRLLLIKGALKYQSAWQKENSEVSVAEALCLQGGVFDLLHIEAGPDNVTIQAISSTELHQRLRSALGQVLNYVPESVNTPIPPVIEEASPAAPPPPFVEPTAPLQEPFTAVQARYEALKGDLQRGLISRDAFLQQVSELRFQDSAGTWWQIAEDGQGWLKWDGSQWVVQ